MPETRLSLLERLKLKDLSLGAHVLALGGFALTTLLFAALAYAYRDAGFWNGWTPSGGFLRPNYAERIYPDRFIRTSSNTWSNQAYMLVGLYAMALAWHDSRRAKQPHLGYLVNTPAMSLLFGIACCYLAIGSGLFHASLTRWGQQLDVAAMYSPLLVFIAISIGTILPRFRASGPPTWPLLWVVVIVVSALLYIYKWEMSATKVLSSLILVTGVLRFGTYLWKRGYQVRWFGLGFASLFFAVICRQTDVAGKFSGPDAVLQGHALWHLLTAACLGFIYLYDRSELHAEGAERG